MKAKKLVKSAIAVKNDSEKLKNGFDPGIDFHHANKIFTEKLKQLKTELKKDYNLHKVKALSNIVISLITLEMPAEFPKKYRSKYLNLSIIKISK